MVREAHILAQQVLRAPEKILQHLRQYVTHPDFLPPLHRFCFNTEDLLSVYPAILMDVTYGIRLAPDDNYFVSLAEEAMAGLSVSTINGTTYLDVFPFMKFIPAWMPGAGFKRAAEHARDVNIAAAIEPWAAAKKMLAPDSVLAKLLDATNNDDVLSRNTASAAYLGECHKTMSRSFCS